MAIDDKDLIYSRFCSHRFLGWRAARAAERLACGRFDGFAKLVGRFLPRRALDGAKHRERVYTPWVIFGAFLSQVLQRDYGCREVVQRVQASRLSLGKKAPSANISPYCCLKRLGTWTLGGFGSGRAGSRAKLGCGGWL